MLNESSFSRKFGIRIEVANKVIKSLFPGLVDILSVLNNLLWKVKVTGVFLVYKCSCYSTRPRIKVLQINSSRVKFAAEALSGSYLQINYVTHLHLSCRSGFGALRYQLYFAVGNECSKWMKYCSQHEKTKFTSSWWRAAVGNLYFVITTQRRTLTTYISSLVKDIENMSTGPRMYVV